MKTETDTNFTLLTNILAVVGLSGMSRAIAGACVSQRLREKYPDRAPSRDEVAAEVTAWLADLKEDASRVMSTPTASESYAINEIWRQIEKHGSDEDALTLLRAHVAQETVALRAQLATVEHDARQIALSAVGKDAVIAKLRVALQKMVDVEESCACDYTEADWIAARQALGATPESAAAELAALRAVVEAVEEFQMADTHANWQESRSLDEALRKYRERFPAKQD